MKETTKLSLVLAAGCLSLMLGCSATGNSENSATAKTSKGLDPAAVCALVDNDGFQTAPTKAGYESVGPKKEYDGSTCAGVAYFGEVRSQDGPEVSLRASGNKQVIQNVNLYLRRGSTSKQKDYFVTMAKAISKMISDKPFSETILHGIDNHQSYLKTGAKDEYVYVKDTEGAYKLSLQISSGGSSLLSFTIDEAAKSAAN